MDSNLVRMDKSNLLIRLSKFNQINSRQKLKTVTGIIKRNINKTQNSLLVNNCAILDIQWSG